MKQTITIGAALPIKQYEAVKQYARENSRTISSTVKHALHSLLTGENGK